MPGTRNVGRNIKEYKRKHPRASRKQAVAVGISEARRAGANIPKYRRKRKK